jgi:hypothetical protein
MALARGRQSRHCSLLSAPRPPGSVQLLRDDSPRKRSRLIRPKVLPRHCCGLPFLIRQPESRACLKASRWPSFQHRLPSSRFLLCPPDLLHIRRPRRHRLLWRRGRQLRLPWVALRLTTGTSDSRATTSLAAINLDSLQVLQLRPRTSRRRGPLLTSLASVPCPQCHPFTAAMIHMAHSPVADRLLLFMSTDSLLHSRVRWLACPWRGRRASSRCC